MTPYALESGHTEGQWRHSSSGEGQGRLPVTQAPAGVFPGIPSSSRSPGFLPSTQTLEKKMRKCHFGTLGNLQTLYRRHKTFSKFLLVVYAAVSLSLQLSRTAVFNTVVVRVCLCHVILPTVLSPDFRPSKHLFSFRIQVNFCHHS